MPFSRSSATVQLSNATPNPTGTAAAGTSQNASRNDHIHAIGAGTALKLLTRSAELSASRAYNTVYQNTSGGAMLVIVNFASTTDALGSLKVGTANPPTEIASYVPSPSPGAARTISVYVPNNYYYKVDVAFTVEAKEWYEWTD